MKKSPIQIVTELEKKVLIAFSRNDHVRDYGWQDPEAAAWVDVLSDDLETDFGMSGKVFSGVMSSLVKKGLIDTNGDSCSMTDNGRKVLKDILD